MRAKTLAVIAALPLAGCGGPQSVLSPAGAEAAELSRLFWVMLIGAVVLWVMLNGLFFYVTRIRTGTISHRVAEGVIIGGGILLPLVGVTALLSFGLNMIPEQRAPGDGLRIAVTGEQWWWRVEYWPEGAQTPIVSANEVRLPAGLRTDLDLTAGKVIHSFWVPALAGKLDMFPGRVNRLPVEPFKPGIYRGQCAEFCGLSHALMAFNAVVLPEEEFDAWLEREAAPAAPEGPAEGRRVFEREGCGACHTVRGTRAVGKVGPDLTHLGSRTSLAAGILPMTEEALIRWVRAPDQIKPGAKMPRYTHLSDEDLARLAQWLEGLK